MPGGLREFFNTFSDKVTTTFTVNIESIVKGNTEMRGWSREVRKIIETVQEVSSKTKKYSIGSFRLVRTLKMDTVLDNVYVFHNGVRKKFLAV